MDVADSTLGDSAGSQYDFMGLEVDRACRVLLCGTAHVVAKRMYEDVDEVRVKGSLGAVRYRYRRVLARGDGRFLHGCGHIIERIGSHGECQEDSIKCDGGRRRGNRGSAMLRRTLTPNRHIRNIPLVTATISAA